MTQKEAEKLVEKQHEGEVHVIYGPSELGELQVWEVWVYHEEKDEYFVRYVIESDSEAPRYFSEFQQFCIFANKLLGTRFQARHANRLRTFIMIVAAFVFISCVCTLLYLVLNNQADNIKGVTVSLLGGLIASGATLFFGAWKKA